jgi:hypothetical protein
MAIRRQERVVIRRRSRMMIRRGVEGETLSLGLEAGEIWECGLI